MKILILKNNKRRMFMGYYKDYLYLIDKINKAKIKKEKKDYYMYVINFAIAIIFQGIGCSVIAFFLFNVAISKIGVNRASSFIGVSTVVSIISGTISLNENFTIYQIIGAFVILSGVYIANTNKADDKKDTD